MTAQLHDPVDATRAPERPRRRLLHFDNLRVALTVLVVMHHAAITYGNIPVWYYVEPATDDTGIALDLFALTNQSFFMGFFFLIAGYFVPASFDRKGPRSFMRGRLVRLGVPLLLFTVALRPILTLNSYLTEWDMPYWLFYIVSWDPGPMWFVEVLLMFSLGYLVVRRLRPRDTAKPSRTTSGRIPRTRAILGFAIGLGLATYVWRAIMTAVYWPVLGLPSPGFLPQYLAMFIVGVYAYRNGWLEKIPRAAMVWCAAAAVVSLAVYVPTMAMAGTVSTEWSPIMLANSLAESGVVIGMIGFATGLFQRIARHQNRFARFLSDNAFAVYVVHSLVLVAGGYALSAWEASALAKFAVLALIAVPLCWLVACTVRTIPGARRVL